MASASNSPFQCEIEKTGLDQQGNDVTRVRCKGRLVRESTDEMRETVKPLIPLGGRIIVDLSELSYLDSSGLGTLVALKISAVKQGLCILEFANMTPRVLELLRITNLKEILSS